MTGRPPPTLEELFQAVLECPPEHRTALLDETCGHDPALRWELEQLVASAGTADAFFEDLAGSVRATSHLELETAARPRIRLGAYQAEEAIGRGGMGVVYRATRVDGGFDQEVALKLLHLDMQTPELQRRFLAERQLLARLAHPNIARLLDGGVTDEGRPFIVMELVAGRPLTEHCRARRTSLEDTLRLFLQVIGAVSYLHRNLVVHRDLKPSNLLVRSDGVVKLLDFGIAKLLADDPESTATVTGLRLMTPQYAAPEQLAGDSVTTATDVFSLGVVLYELLSGCRPRQQRAGADRPPEDTLTAPSEALRSVQAGVDPDDRPPWHRLPRDLDNICLMALRPEPERRYASAEQLGRDIERFLDGRPVSATADTLSYRLGTLARRHWRSLSVVALMMVVIGVSMARERSLRRDAQQSAQKARAVSAFLAELFSSADPARAQGSDVSVLEVLDRADEQLASATSFADRPAVEAEVRLILGRTYRALGRNQDAVAQLEAALELAGGLEADEPAAMDAAEALATTGLPSAGRREQLLRRVVEFRAATLGEADAATLAARRGLVGALLAQSRRQEAEDLARGVLATASAELGPEHPDTLLAANRLAAVLFGDARYDEAAALYRDALAISRRVRGPTHPETLRLVANLGTTYAALGRYAEAEPLQREVVAEQRRILGDDHHRTGMSMHNLGSLLRRQGRYEEAAVWFRRAVAARDDAIGAGYLYSQSFLADTLRDLGRTGEAEALFRETLELQRALLAPDHPDTPRTAVGLAELYRRRGDLVAAEALATRALEPQLSVAGEKHLDAADTLIVLARIRTAQERHAEAVELARRAQAIRREVFPEDHPVVLESRLVLAETLCAAGEQNPVRSELDGLVAALDDRLGPDHPTTLEARRAAASCRPD